jgi:hypothetical protein
MSDPGITNENQLLELAHKLKIHIDDIETIDELKSFKPNGSYILLLQNKTRIGHWIAFNKGEYFDSFGEPPPVKIACFVKKYNQRQFQSVDQNFCGWWSILFLYARQKNRPDLLNQMTDVSF